MLHEQDYTPWEGHEVHAWPSLTVLRGKVVVENGAFHADPSDGEYLYRRISDEIRSGATL
jgi:dihydropyrimidinase